MSKRALLLCSSVLLFFAYHSIPGQHESFAELQVATIQDGKILSYVCMGSYTVAVLGRGGWEEIGGRFYSWLF